MFVFDTKIKDLLRTDHSALEPHNFSAYIRISQASSLYQFIILVIRGTTQ